MVSHKKGWLESWAHWILMGVSILPPFDLKQLSPRLSPEHKPTFFEGHPVYIVTGWCYFALEVPAQYILEVCGQLCKKDVEAKVLSHVGHCYGPDGRGGENAAPGDGPGHNTLRHWALTQEWQWRTTFNITVRLSGWVVKWSESYHKGRTFESRRCEKLSVQELHLGMTHQQILVYEPLVGFQC